ncbi:MAG TPA: hypothetical protein VFS21_17015 [Roseiflexaceae bacterium]|nr:hypothetical protein [Roseiflexaceae bacterium]
MLLFIVMLLLLGAPVSACLPLELRDVNGAPVAATVQVRDDAGQLLDERAIDPTSGQVSLCALPGGAAVRVLVRGQLADGTPLRQSGADAAGVWVWLAGDTAPIRLRVEPTGEVLPDPSGLASERVPVARSAVPTATTPATDVRATLVAAAAQPVPTAQATALAVPSAGMPEVAGATAIGVGVIVGPPLCLMALALASGAGVFVLVRRRKT